MNFAELTSILISMLLNVIVPANAWDAPPAMAKETTSAAQKDPKDRRDKFISSTPISLARGLLCDMRRHGAHQLLQRIMQTIMERANFFRGALLRSSDHAFSLAVRWQELYCFINKLRRNDFRDEKRRIGAEHPLGHDAGNVAVCLALARYASEHSI